MFLLRFYWKILNINKILKKNEKRAMLHWKTDGVYKLISNILDFNCAKFHKKCSYTSKDIECV